MKKQPQKRWRIGSGHISEFIYADDQFEAWDSLRDRPAEDFGLLATAEPNEVGSDDSFPIRTSILMFRWGRDADAARFIKRMMEEGVPDTTEEDRAAAEVAR